MGSISPVIANFLAGQQAQQGIQEQAQNWALKKQQLDQALSEFDQNHKLEQQKLDTQNRLLSANIDHAHAEARQQLIQNVQSGAQPVPQQPGPPQQVSASGSMAGMQIPGISLPTQQNVPIGTPMTAIDSYGNPQTFPRPQTNLEALSATKAIDSKNAIDQYNQTIGKTDNLKFANDMAMKNAQIDMLNRYHDLQDQGRSRDEATRLMIAEMKGRSDMQMEWAKLGYTSPQQVQTNGANYATLAATGQLSPDVEKMMNPMERQLYKNTMANNGYLDVAPKDMAALQDAAGSGVQILNNTNRFLQDQKPPTTLAGSAAGYVQTGLGLNRTYNNYKATTIAAMEKAQGLPLGRINGSPATIKQFEPMLVQPYEQGATVDYKKASMADLVTNSLAKQLNKYVPAQRQMLLRSIIDSNPGIENNPELSQRIHQFLDKGTFTPTNPIPEIPQ